MSLLHQTKIIILHSDQVLSAYLFDGCSCHRHRIVFGYSRDYLLLLGLILYDSPLFSVAHSLLSKEGVASCYDDGLSVDFWRIGTDGFSDGHHGSITHSRVTNLFISSFITYLDILVK